MFLLTSAIPNQKRIVSCSWRCVKRRIKNASSSPLAIPMAALVSPQFCLDKIKKNTHLRTYIAALTPNLHQVLYSRMLHFSHKTWPLSTPAPKSSGAVNCKARTFWRFRGMLLRHRSPRFGPQLFLDISVLQHAAAS